MLNELRVVFLRRLRHIFRFGAAAGQHRPPQHPLDLAVEAAQLVVGPLLEGLQKGRIDAEKICLALGQGRLRWECGVY
jgi:hypothetical protein